MGKYDTSLLDNLDEEHLQVATTLCDDLIKEIKKNPLIALRLSNETEGTLHNLAWNLIQHLLLSQSFDKLYLHLCAKDKNHS